MASGLQIGAGFNTDSEALGSTVELLLFSATSFKTARVLPLRLTFGMPPEKRTLRHWITEKALFHQSSLSFEIFMPN